MNGRLDALSKAFEDFDKGIFEIILLTRHHLCYDEVINSTQQQRQKIYEQ